MTCLPIRRPKTTAVAVAHASVSGVTTTSSSGIFSTGEKKCMPRTRLGWRVPQAAAERLEAGVLRAHGDAGLDRYGGDAGAHEAGPQHRQLVDFAGPGALGVPRILLYVLGGEEDRHEVAGHVGDGQLAEVA